MAIRRPPATWRSALAERAGVGVLLGLLSACLLAAVITPGASAEPEWTTYHHDPERTGVDPEAFSATKPVLAWQTQSLGAGMWGQPVVLGEKLYAATVGDELYALNAVTGQVDWQESAGTPVPAEELPCGDITPTVGIVSTPLIDTSTGMIYVVADTWDQQTREAKHLLESFNLQTGAPGLSVPVDPPGVNPETILQRSALNLDEGQIVFGFGGNFGSCSQALAPLVTVPASGGPARFWQTHNSPFETTAGGVWATGGATVEAGTDDIYVATANPLPTVSIDQPEFDYSNSLVELSLSDFVSRPLGEPLAQLGWFEPPDWEERSNDDLDLGSAGPVLLPGGIIFEAGKDGVGYLVEDAALTTTHGEASAEQVCAGEGGSFGGDSFVSATNTIYIPCTNGVQALAYEPGTPPKFKAVWKGPEAAFGSPILAGGALWVLATGGFEGGGRTLYELEPSTGDVIDEATLPSPITDHFGSPTAAGGRLFVASGCSVTAYEISSSPDGGFTTQGPPTNAQCPPAPPPGNKGSGGSLSNPSPSAQGSAQATTTVVQGTPAALAPTPAPLLLKTKLKATPAGEVRLRLRCTATSGSCAGHVTLNARVVIVRGRGAHRTHRVLLIRLAKAPFHHPRGDFTLTITLSRAAIARLHAHGNRLALRVAISSGTGQTRFVSALLT